MGMPEKVIGISEYVVTTDPEMTLVTYSLGSCVGLSLYDPVARVGGLLHAMMPASKTNPDKAAERPAMYVDTGALAMLTEMFAAGATRANLVANVVGAASPLDQGQLFRIGERNYAVTRRVLWKNGILISAEDVGGVVSRTVYLEMASGKTLVKAQGSVREL